MRFNEKLILPDIRNKLHVKPVVLIEYSRFNNNRREETKWYVSNGNQVYVHKDLTLHDTLGELHMCDSIDEAEKLLDLFNKKFGIINFITEDEFSI